MAGRVTKRLPSARHFDPEWVGYLLMDQLGDQEFTDFQQLPPWRTLVPVVADELTRFTGQHLVAPQSVLEQEYWRQLRTAFAALTLDVFTVLLDVEPDVLADRIVADELEAQARRWRLDRIQTYAARRAWMLESADLVVDSTAVPVGEVAGRIVGAVAPLLPATGSARSR